MSTASWLRGQNSPHSSQTETRRQFLARGGKALRYAALGAIFGSSGMLPKTAHAAIVPPAWMPYWSVPDISGSGVWVNPSQYFGKVLYLVFTQIGCESCEAELETQVLLHNRYQHEGLETLLIYINQNNSTVAAYVSGMGLNPDSVVGFNQTWRMGGSNNSILTAMEIAGVSPPLHFLVSREGMIIFRQNGDNGEDFQPTLETQIRKTLRTPKLFQWPTANGGREIIWANGYPTNSVLEHSSTVGPSAVWSDYPTPPVLSNGLWRVPMPTTNSAKFFRLRVPALPPFTNAAAAVLKR